MEYRRIVPALLMAGLLAGAAAARAETVRVPKAPDVVRPGEPSRFVPLSLTHLQGDADFPVLLLGKVDAGFPQFAWWSWMPATGRTRGRCARNPSSSTCSSPRARAISRFSWMRDLPIRGMPRGCSSRAGQRNSSISWHASAPVTAGTGLRQALAGSDPADRAMPVYRPWQRQPPPARRDEISAVIGGAQPSLRGDPSGRRLPPPGRQRRRFWRGLSESNAEPGPGPWGW